MLNWLIKWDDLIIDVVEKKCQRIQRLTGITNFTLAKMLVPLIVLMNLNRSEYSVNRYINFSDALMGIVVHVLALSVTELYTKHPRFALFRNPTRSSYSYRMIRAIIFGAMTVTAVRICLGNNLFVNLGFWAAEYLFFTLLACTPLPPGMSKLKEWLNGLTFTRQKEVLSEG